MKSFIIMSIAAVAVVIASCSSYTTPARSYTPGPSGSTPAASPTSTSQALAQVHDPGQLTFSAGEPAAGSCHFNGSLPDSSCTPGAIDPAVTQANIHQTICVSGYTTKVRPPSSQTTPAKYNIFYPAYSVPSGTVSELDHLVPLELGGANDGLNLWPEVGSIPNPKDPVENDLKTDVCAGEMSLVTAQNAIATNWQTVP